MISRFPSKCLIAPKAGIAWRCVPQPLLHRMPPCC
jgi:hypothetical protein